MSVFFLVFALFGVLRATNLFDCNPRDFYGGFDPSDYSNPYELKKAVHDLIDGHVIIPYGDCDEAMEILDANPNGVGVIGIYSLLPKHPFPDTWNREHVWPRSRGVGDSGADTSDLFHLFPTDMNLNSARGNKYFDECTPGSNGCESPAGTSSEDAAPGTSENSNVWAPPPSMRGDLARAVFYMAVRYDGSDSSTTNLKIKECSSEGSCGSNTFGRLSTLLKWHREDPVSSAELARIDGICSGYQGNRNPFVDFPELADRLESVFADDGFEVEYEVHVPSVLFMSTGGSLIILSAFFLVAYIAGYRVHRVQDKKEAGVVGEVMASSL